MNIRLANKNDIPRLEVIVKKARKKLKDENIDQWQKAYPDEELLTKKISDNSLFVLENEEDVLGMMSLSFLEDEDYKTITQGKWKSDYDYAVIHSVAVDTDLKGQHLSTKLFDFAIEKAKENNIRSIRIDTHKDNKTMKAILKKYKFEKTGEITLSRSNEKRDAFEKIIIDFVVGDVISLKKNHPCGNNIFQIESLGMDFRLRCIECNSQIRLYRKDVSKRLKKRLTKEEIEKLREDKKVK